MNPSNPFIIIEDLKLGYDKKELVSARKLQFSLGQHYALVGNNGSGKTSFLRALIGMPVVIKGSIILNGKNVKNLTQSEIASLVCYIPTKFDSNSELTLNEFYQICLTQRSNLLLPEFKGIASKAKNFIFQHKIENIDNRPVSTLSTGEQRKALVLTALLVDTPIILIDEPTNGLDPSNLVEVLEILSQINKLNNRCVIQVTHSLNNELKLANSVLAVKNKEIVDYGTINNFYNPQVLHDIYGVSFDIHKFNSELYLYPKRI